MKSPDPFDIWAEDDHIRVRFVAQGSLGRLSDNRHASGGDYVNRTIRLPRYEYRSALRAALLHELGHYLADRQELRDGKITVEDACEVLTWLPSILVDKRNRALRAFLGL